MYAITLKFISLSKPSACNFRYMCLNVYPKTPFKCLRDISNLPCPKTISSSLKLNCIYIFSISVNGISIFQADPLKTLISSFLSFLYDPQILH